VRGAQCGVGAVGERLPPRLEQLLRLSGRETQRSQDGSATAEVTQGSPAVVAAHPQRILSPAQRAVVCGEGGRGAAALVETAAQRTVVSHDHSGTRWALLRQLTRLATIATTDGTRTDVHNPKHLGRKQRKLARLEREKSRRQKGSVNRDKTRRKVAVAHNEVARARQDYHHKQALALVRDNQVIYVEDLNIVGMVANRRLARAISDAGWGQFVRIIGEKADRYGRTVHRVSRWLASSKTCSACGHRVDKLPLRIRQWACPACRVVHDRDHNAAKVILAAGRAERRNACGAPVSPPNTREARGDEAGSTRTAAQPHGNPRHP
jgi:IS605 OrfB family transposase